MTFVVYGISELFQCLRRHSGSIVFNGYHYGIITVEYLNGNKKLQVYRLKDRAG